MRRQKPVLRDMVNAFDAIHIARRDGVERGQAPWMSFGSETFAQRLQHRIGAPQCGGGGDGHNRIIGNARDRFGRADMLAHRSDPAVIDCGALAGLGGLGNGGSNGQRLDPVDSIG